MTNYRPEIFIFNQRRENKIICRKCRRLCCKRMPGCIFPEDIINNKTNVFELLSNMIKSGNYCFDFWEGDPRPKKEQFHKGYFLRPVCKNAIGKCVDASWGGECIFLTNIGCELKFENRPRECQNLIPKMEDGKVNCYPLVPDSKRLAAIQWIPYYGTIEAVINIITGY